MRCLVRESPSFKFTIGGPCVLLNLNRTYTRAVMRMYSKRKNVLDFNIAHLNLRGARWKMIAIILVALL